MKIGGVTTKRKIKKWEFDEEIVQTKIWDLSTNLYKIFNAKLGPNCSIIVPSSSYLFNIMAKAMMPYDVQFIASKDWESFKGIETNKIKIYTAWYDSHPFVDWIKKEIITKDDYLLMMGTDKNFKLYQEHCHVIDVWMNTEGDLGLKFDGCDKYHTIIHTLMGVVDDTIEFTKTKDNCHCGFDGDVFTWKEKEK